ncbi:ATP-dependent zinc protease [Pseudidiomarina gelatinasegens]|uniref:ATP-dependent zinc protease family protein n=1 Tax=Pseudidiomarina gelatinasegens TaxID=2487740 RepID=UPI003A97D1D7
MFSRLLSPARFAIAITAGTVMLAGCASDSYLMVPKNNLVDIHGKVTEQRNTLATMESASEQRHQELLNKSDIATERVLRAIVEQVEKPSCPPIPKQPVCTVQSAEDKGRADRLKGKVVVGEVEKLFLVGPGYVYDARIDSGAETSSLDARNITRFERDGQNWVRFDIPKPGTDGELTTLEREISRRVRIIQSNVDEPERRVVVEMQFSIGDHQQQAEFTLTDRSHLTHSVLIGRNVLRDVMLIDVGKEYATELPASLLDNKDDSN